MNKEDIDPYDFDSIIKKNDEEACKQAIAYKNLLIEYQALFASEKGIRIFEDLQFQFNSRPSYELGSDLNDACYLEGQKSVIAYIFEMLRINPETIDIDGTRKHIDR